MNNTKKSISAQNSGDAMINKRIRAPKGFRAHSIPNQGSLKKLENLASHDPQGQIWTCAKPETLAHAKQIAKAGIKTVIGLEPLPSPVLAALKKSKIALIYFGWSAFGNMTRQDAENKLRELKPKGKILIYCAGGNVRSRMLARFLHTMRGAAQQPAAPKITVEELRRLSKRRQWSPQKSPARTKANRRRTWKPPAIGEPEKGHPKKRHRELNELLRQANPLGRQ